MNLKTAEGAALARRLVSMADVVIENSATGAMQRLGLSYHDLRQINPRIIMFSTQLLGASGPWKNWSGYGPNAHAVSGLQYLWNYPQDRETPAGSTNIHPDHLVGRLGALGAVAALLRRQRDGSGAHVQVAQFEALVQLLGDLFIKESLAPGNVIFGTQFVPLLAETLPVVAERLPRLDVVTLNPPRKGADAATCAAIAAAAPARIAYISCDPTTLARDLDWFAAHGYRTVHLQPFDLLP